MGAAIEWLTAVVSETTKKLFTSAERAGTWFEAERATSIAIVVSAARRPDYHDMTLTLAIALGDVPESQRHWLKDFQRPDPAASVHPFSRRPAQVRQDLQWFWHAAPFPT